MKSLLSGLVLLISLVASADSALIGEWKLNEMIYRGERIPLPNPELNLRFTFLSNGTERLYWDRGTDEFCERWARYTVAGKTLQQEVFAVNPGNAAECKKDPDMQMGRVTHTPIELQGSELHLVFQMGDEELVYVFRVLDP